MSFDPGEYQGPDTIHCPGCEAEKNGDYKLKQCAERGCENLGCACLRPCESGNHPGVYCDEHRYRVTLAPGCVVEACDDCRAEIEIAELLEEAEV